MKTFLDEHFLLHGSLAEELYHAHAARMPIIDYHNHLSPQLIAENHRFENITRAWLEGDHYKWRAMRAHGVEESFCTGGADDWQKFLHWANTVPYTVRNPLYHWTHLELQRYFGIRELLSPDTATSIWHRCNEQLQQEGHRVRGLLEGMRVELLCTTDDPSDDLQFHARIRAEGWAVKVLPAFRPDKVLQVADPAVFNAYLDKLGRSGDVSVHKFHDLLDLLKKRHDFFASMGCTVSDHGMECLVSAPCTEAEASWIFDQIRMGKPLSIPEVEKYQGFVLRFLAELHWEKGWVQQFHLGAFRNNNTRMMQRLGPDTGWDSIGDARQGPGLRAFLDDMDREGKLAKTILYNLNPADNALFATMAGNFNDGTVAGKMQWGSAWWFLDQQDGMREQMQVLSRMGLIAHFVGMLTDSRSFLSFPRHEYFRRILCQVFATDVENGELPNDIPWIGKMVEDICYHNAKRYFGF